jgi:hypothetical protein
MYKKLYTTLLVSDFLAILSFFIGALYLYDYFAKYPNTEDPFYYFVIPAVIISIFLILRIYKSIKNISNDSDTMINPFFAAILTLFAAGCGFPPISDLWMLSPLIFIISFLFSKNKQANVGVGNKHSLSYFRALRIIIWLLFVGLPVGIIIWNITFDPGHSEGLVGLYMSLPFLIFFTFIVDRFSAKAQKSSSNT